MINITNKNIFIKFIILIFIGILLILNSCAVIKAPSGGPDDTTPPEIVEVYPENNSINYNGETIYFKFNEYLDKSSVVENVRISPKFTPDFSWTGKKLKIKPKSDLMPNTTYSITLEPGYKDIVGNKPDNSYSIIFSTGNYLDSGFIGGTTKNAMGYSVFLYNISNINPDTLNIKHTKPNYIAKIGESGEYSVLALPDATYRLFLVNDQNLDELYNEGIEEISAYSKDIILNQRIKQNNTSFYETKIVDKNPPELLESISLAEQIIQLSMNEEIDTFSLNSTAFILLDSLTNEKIKINAAIISQKDNKNILLYSDKKMINNNYYRIIIDNLLFPIKDISGNKINSKITSEPFQYVASDTITAFNLMSSISDNSTNISLSPKINIIFSFPISNPEVGEIILNFNDSKKNLPTKYEFINSNTISISPVNRLNSNSNYKISIPIKGIVSAIGQRLPDTTLILNFLTEDLRLNGSLSGNLRINGATGTVAGNYYIVLTKTDGKFDELSMVDSTAKWEYLSLTEGEYVINVFKDENNNGKYDSGSIYPFIPAEKYFLVNKKVNVVQRWKVEDIIIDITE